MRINKRLRTVKVLVLGLSALLVLSSCKNDKKKTEETSETGQTELDFSLMDARFPKRMTEGQVMFVALNMNKMNTEFLFLAKKKGSTKEVVRFGKAMGDHAMDFLDTGVKIAKANKIAQKKSKLGISYMQGMQKHLKQLRKQSGEDFDRLFVTTERGIFKRFLHLTKDRLLPNAKTPDLQDLLKKSTIYYEKCLENLKKIQEQ